MGDLADQVMMILLAWESAPNARRRPAAEVAMEIDAIYSRRCGGEHCYARACAEDLQKQLTEALRTKSHDAEVVRPKEAEGV